MLSYTDLIRPETTSMPTDKIIDMRRRRIELRKEFIGRSDMLESLGTLSDYTLLYWRMQMVFGGELSRLSEKELRSLKRIESRWIIPEADYLNAGFLELGIRKIFLDERRCIEVATSVRCIRKGETRATYLPEYDSPRPKRRYR